MLQFIDAENWFYVFQPTAQGAVKFAQHSSGSIAKTVVKSRDGAGDLQTVSAPPAWSREYGDQGNMIPLKQLKYLRQALSAIYPELAKKDFAWTRLCW
jgi:sarcosine oxidase/L-pipecolate oxidase